MSYLIPPMLVALVSSFTPGPNNSMLMQSGMLFGFRKTTPHILGVVVGFNILFLAISLGIYAIVQTYALFSTILKIIGSVYFTFLAWKMLKMHHEPADVQSDSAHSQKPFGFFTIVLFQWINIKAWFFAISVTATLPANRGLPEQIVMQIIIVIITLGSALTWTSLGVFVNSIFKNPHYLKIISVILALFLIYAGVAQWFPQ